MRARRLGRLIAFVAASLAPTPSGASAQVAMEAMRAEQGYAYALTNHGSDTVELIAPDPYTRPVVRVEARQRDGAWVERAWVGRYGLRVPADATIAPDATLVLTPANGYDGVTDAPGTYRVVVTLRRADGAEQDVALTYRVAGWSRSLLDDAWRLRERARRAGCTGTAARIEGELVSRLGAGPLRRLHRRSDEAQRAGIEWEMLSRGGFVSLLSRRLATAPLGHVREMGWWLAGQADPIQEPLRAVVVRRLVAPLRRSPRARPPDDYHLLQQLQEHWRADTAEHLVRHLERGRERGAALVALVQVFAYSDPARLSDVGERARAALVTRCASATGDPIARACRMALANLDPSRPVRAGRGFSRGGRCAGGGAIDHPSCTRLLEDWTALRARAGDATLEWIGSGPVTGP